MSNNKLYPHVLSSRAQFLLAGPCAFLPWGCSLSLHWAALSPAPKIWSWYTSEPGVDKDQRCSLVVIPRDGEFPDSGLAGKWCCLITLPQVLPPSSCLLDTIVVVIVGTSLRSLYLMSGLEMLWVLLLQVLWPSVLCPGELPLAYRSHLLGSPWRGYVTPQGSNDWATLQCKSIKVG